MDFTGYLPFPDKELGGGADYDDPTCIPMGLAVVCRNMRFRRRSVRTRDGYQHTMSYAIDAGEPGIAPLDMTGVEALDVLVNNPQQIVVASDSNGDLLQETPAGGGAMTPLTTPFALPAGISMQTAKAFNRIYMAFSNLVNALTPPLALDGPTGVVTPVSQNPIGAIWTPGRNYLVGDVVRTSQNPNRWFRCTTPGQAGNIEPTWPTLDGYLSGRFFFACTINDPNGPSIWEEWTPTAQQFLPAPEAPEQVISIKGQSGAPSGSIAVAQDVYVCFAYQNALGETAWTVPIVYQNSLANDVIEVFFQKQNEVPGPIVAAAYNAAGYGGPRMPGWLLSVLAASDPLISWPSVNCLNVYVASVAHGTAAPVSYYQYASATPVSAPALIASIPASGTLFTPRVTPSAALTKLPFIGAGGPRYLAVARLDINDSLVPIDPGSPLQFSFLSSIAGSGQATITFIQRTAAGVVTCTVDQLAGFSQSSQVIIAGVTDTSFDGTFTLTGVSPNQYGGATLIWTQTAGTQPPAAASTGGTATSASAASAFVTPQALIATISITADLVSAIVNSLNGLEVGTQINVAGVANAQFNGTFTVTAITANTGGGGTVQWNQTAADASSTGGVISPTGVAVGTNTPQAISFLARNEYPASPGGVIAIVFNPQGTPQNPPAGYEVGAQIVVQGVTDGSFDGTFVITNATPNPGKGGGYSIHWTQTGASAKYNPANGTITLLSGAPLQQAQGNLTAIARAGGTVTATIDSGVANFVLGGEVQVTNVLDVTYDGTFTIIAINVGASTLQWTQAGPNSSSSGGEIVQTTGGNQQPTPVAVLPPGGPFIAEDIAAWSVEGGTQAGPFTFIPQQDPITPFSAQILSIGNVDGAVTALLSSTSGLVAGDTVQVSGTPNGWFDGVFVLAQVAGNTVEWAGVGPGTGYASGRLSLVPTQPTAAMGQNNPVAINSMARTASGIVSAQISDVSNLVPGMRIQVVGAISGAGVATFNGQFVVLSVSQNQLPGSPTPLAGTVTWQSSTLAAGTSTGGSLTGLPGIILDAIDNDLANADDVTPQLATIPAPSCVNVFFSESLNMMVYTVGQDSSHYFSNPGDPANVANPGGILGVVETNGQRTRGFVETISGELISLKEKSGYEITVGSSTPNEYGVSRRWFGHGPCGPRAWDAADDFIVYFDEDSGLYRYHQGVAMQVGQEKQGTWDRLTKTASAQVCVAIDNVRKEIHIGLPVDGATVPNHDLVLNYFNGWEEPLMLTMTGELMPNPHGRRWSDNDGAANGGNFRLVKVIQRTLPAPPSPIIVHRQVVFCLSGLQQTDGATGYIDMSVPGQMTDNGAAIAPQYQPAFAQSPTLEGLVWDKMKARVLGLGNNSPVCIQPLTEDPNADLAPVTINLSDGLPDSRTLGFSEEVNELFSVLYSNQDPDTGVPIPGAGFELHRSVKYGKVRSSGTPEDQGSN